MARAGRKRKSGERNKSGRLVVKPNRVEPCMGVMRRRALYGTAANDTDTIDALGRAYATGLLGNGDRAKDLLNAGRRIAWQYWRIFKPMFPTPDSLARFQPQSPSHRPDPEREKILEDALNDALELVRKRGRDVNRAFEQLVIDPNPDQGPRWLDAIVYAHRRHKTASEMDMNMLRLAIEGLETIA